MKVRITTLKAPWPAGAVVGDVLDLPELPAWAAGKCVQVGDDVALTIASGEGEGAGQPLPVIDEDDAKIAAALAEADKMAAEELAAIEKRKAKHK